MPPKVSISSGISRPDIFKDNCKDGWTGLEGGAGEDSQLIIDLGCFTTIETIELRNLNMDHGTKKFSLYLSQAKDGDWTELYTGTLTLDNIQVCRSESKE